jgi:hypothetical protein
MRGRKTTSEDQTEVPRSRRPSSSHSEAPNALSFRRVLYTSYYVDKVGDHSFGGMLDRFYMSSTVPYAYLVVYKKDVQGIMKEYNIIIIDRAEVFYQKT